MLEFLQMVTGIFVVVYDGQHALKKLADEKLSLYRQFHDEQKLSSEATVSLISGAVMALPAQRPRVPEQALPVPATAPSSDRRAGAPSSPGDASAHVAE